MKNPKNVMTFFDVSFDKNIIKDYIKMNVDGKKEITDSDINENFKSILNRIIEESLTNLKDLYLNNNFKYIQIQINGHKEEPIDKTINVTLDEKDTDNVNITY
jgi:hypothetical protein